MDTPAASPQQGFASDNTAGASPQILAALLRANEGQAPAYGADDTTLRVERRLAAIFERAVDVLLVPTGPAA
ncbi:low specificity L-threonine aldolase, partial [Achromobacter ruhlandii]